MLGFIRAKYLFFAASLYYESDLNNIAVELGLPRIQERDEDSLVPIESAWNLYHRAERDHGIDRLVRLLDSSCLIKSGYVAVFAGVPSSNTIYDALALICKRLDSENNLATTRLCRVAGGVWLTRRISSAPSSGQSRAMCHPSVEFVTHKTRTVTLNGYRWVKHSSAFSQIVTVPSGLSTMNLPPIQLVSSRSVHGWHIKFSPRCLFRFSDFSSGPNRLPTRSVSCTATESDRSESKARRFGHRIRRRRILRLQRHVCEQHHRRFSLARCREPK